MQITSPTPIVVVPANQQTVIEISRVVVDMIAHTITIVYHPVGGQDLAKTDTVPLPGAMQTAIRNHVQARIEAKEGVSGTSVTTP